MKITTQTRASDLDVPIADLQLGEEVEITGTARVVGIQEELVVNVYPGEPNTSPDLLVTLALEVRPA